MAKTKIEWATDSWNPIRAIDRATGKRGWYCEHATPGCEHCYSEALNRRFGTRVDYARQNRDRVELFLDERILKAPLCWRDPRRIFVCSMTDLFAEFVPDEWIGQIWGVMALAPQHTFLVLTKRTERMRQWCSWVEDESGEKNPAAHGVAELYVGHPAIAGKWPLDRERAIGVAKRGWPLPNVWLGGSVEDQRRADLRIPELLATSAAVRWISAEPLLGPVELNSWPGKAWFHRRPEALDWVVVGGESGPGARPMHPDWARSLRDQCVAAGVPFFFKQWGEWLGADQVWAAIAADELRAAGKLRLDEAGQPIPPELPPLNFQEAEVIADGRPLEHHSDGSTLIRVGKKRAGRELDGRTWDEYPREENR
jgi:protein gp37